MRHGYFGRNLSRSSNEKKQLLRILVNELVMHGSIQTTIAKAKAVQPTVDKLITRAKKGEEQKRNLLMDLPYPEAVKKLLMDAQTRFGTRSSGYTRIIKTNIRRGDATQQVLLSFVDAPVEIIEPKTQKDTKAESAKQVKPAAKKEEPKAKKPRSVKKDK